MTMTPEAKAIFDRVEAPVRDACAHIFAHPLDRASHTREIRAWIDALAGPHTADLWYDFTWDDTLHCTIVPRNLFTGMLLAGCMLDEALPHRDPTCVAATLDRGTYRLINDRMYFQPKTPAEMIVLNLTLADERPTETEAR